MKINKLAFGYAGAIISALIMLILGTLGNLGFYMGAVEMMSEWHVFFSLSIGGIIAGMIEALVISFIFCYSFAVVYNKYATK